MKRFNQRIHSHEPPQLNVPMTIQQRVRSRQRIELSNGEEALMEIERGITLRDGDCLACDDGTTIRVVSAPETISKVTADSPHLLARVCYHLGNRHVPLQITPHWASYLHDHVLDDMVRGLGAQVEVQFSPFEPEDGAYGGTSHSHAHSH